MRSIEAEDLSVPHIERPRDGSILMTWDDGKREVCVNVMKTAQVIVSMWTPNGHKIRKSPLDGPRVLIVRQALGWLFPDTNDADEQTMLRYGLVPK